MTNPITPKVAYIPLEYTVDEFLQHWEFFFQETEGNPTQKDYDKWCLFNAKVDFYLMHFYLMRGEIEDNIRLMEDN